MYENKCSCLTNWLSVKRRKSLMFLYALHLKYLTNNDLTCQNESKSSNPDSIGSVCSKMCVWRSLHVFVSIYLCVSVDVFVVFNGVQWEVQEGIWRSQCGLLCRWPEADAQGRKLIRVHATQNSSYDESMHRGSVCTSKMYGLSKKNTTFIKSIVN